MSIRTSIRLPAESLNRHLEVRLKADRIGNVPAIESEALAGFVNPVGRKHLSEPRVGRAEGLIAMGRAVLKIVGAAEVILRAGATDCGELLVAIEEELDLAFAPPTGAA